MSSMGPIEIQPGATADAQPQASIGPIGIERGVPPDVGAPVGSPPDWTGETGHSMAPAPAAPELTVPGGPGPLKGEPTLEGLLAQSQQTDAMARKSVAQQKSDFGKYSESEKARIDKEATLTGEKMAAERKATEDFANAQQDIITAQNLSRQEWDKRRAELDAQNQAYMTELNAHIANSHPTSIWGAAGMNPVFGTIGLALGQLGTFAGGTNSVMETIKMRASVRAQQLMGEGQALEQKGSTLSRLANQAREIYGSELSASEKLQSALLQNYKAQVDLVANKYASPTARLKAVELKNAIDLKSIELNQKADDRALENRHSKMKEETNILHLLTAARSVNDKVNKTTEARIEKSIGPMITAIEYFDHLKNSSSTNTNPLTRAGYAQEYLSSAAMARGVPEGSLSRYLPKEYTGAGIMDPLAAVPQKLGLIGKDRHLSAVIGSQEALDSHARSLVTRMDAIRQLSPVYEAKIRAAGVPTLAEFDKKYGLNPSGAINQGIADPFSFVDEKEFKE